MSPSHKIKERFKQAKPQRANIQQLKESRQLKESQQLRFIEYFPNYCHSYDSILMATSLISLWYKFQIPRRENPTGSPGIRYLPLGSVSHGQAQTRRAQTWPLGAYFCRLGLLTEKAESLQVVQFLQKVLAPLGDVLLLSKWQRKSTQPAATNSMAETRRNIFLMLSPDHRTENQTEVLAFQTCDLQEGS